jgi:dimethylhistidine N-methyltransferase
MKSSENGSGAGRELVGTEEPQPKVDSADARTIRSEVERGLRGRPPSLPCRFFYDARGARLFEQITRLEEYYLTDAEMEILRRRASRVAELVGPGVRMVEYGSGSGDKTWIVLGELEEPTAYVPIDVAREQLMSFSAEVRVEFPDVEVLPVVADYTRLSSLPWPTAEAGATLAFFPGSTVGNLEPQEAVRFLSDVARQIGGGEFLLLGTDLVKDRSVLERAYNDADGVTAAFNRNILHHLNRLLGADFEPEAFAHRAIWNERASRIEMHLVSRRDQRVSLGGDRTENNPIRIREGEAVVTEHSYKYSITGLHDLAARAGYRPVEWWTDEAQLFAVHLLQAGGRPRATREGG